MKYNYKVTIYKVPIGGTLEKNGMPVKARRFTDYEVAASWGAETAREFWECENADWYNFQYEVASLWKGVEA